MPEAGGVLLPLCLASHFWQVKNVSRSLSDLLGQWASFHNRESPDRPAGKEGTAGCLLFANSPPDTAAQSTATSDLLYQDLWTLRKNLTSLPHPQSCAWLSEIIHDVGVFSDINLNTCMLNRHGWQQGLRGPEWGRGAFSSESFQFVWWWKFMMD